MDDRGLFGFKRKKSRTEPAEAEGIQFTFEERAELFEDLLEDDTSTFPLLESPHEVLAAVGAFLDAGHLAALSELCTQANSQLDDAFADAWTALLLRDHMPTSRAKRYRAYSGAMGDNQRAHHRSPGLVLTAVDLSRIEWDGLLLAAPSHLRYRFLQTMGALKQRWGRLATSWEWFATRVMRRMTFDQLERLVPGFGRPEVVQATETFDEVWHQACLDRQLRKRHVECNPTDVIASVKRSLGIAAEDKQAAPEMPKPAQADAIGGAQDVLSALAPTARDQRLQEAERAAAAGAEGADALVQLPSREAIERMSFSEQLDLALKVSQASSEDSIVQQGSKPPSSETGSKAADTAEVIPQEEGAAASSVLFRLKAAGLGNSQENLEVVLRECSAGEVIIVPEQLRRSLEQIALRLTREDWLLFYDSVAKEAQLRARVVAHHLRIRWLRLNDLPARRLLDLEALMFHLPIFGGEREGLAARGISTVVPEELLAEARESSGLRPDETFLTAFLEAWQEYEDWAVSLEEHLGPLDLEVSRERTINLQRGRAHTPYTGDLCRLAFRNFAICEGRLFFRVALSIYRVISRLFQGEKAGPAEYSRLVPLLNTLHTMAQTYAIPDDALAVQRSTLQEFKLYLLEPLQRASWRLQSADLGGEDHDEDED